MSLNLPGNLPAGATGLAIFTDDRTGAHTGCTGTQAQIDTAYAAWFLLHPEPPIILPNTIISLPTANPGITGALHLVNNTLQVSQGPVAAAIQIGSTGPTGGATV